MENENGFLTIHETVALAKISKPSIYRLEKLGKFPKRRKVGLRMVRWVKSEILDFIKQSPVKH